MSGIVVFKFLSLAPVGSSITIFKGVRNRRTLCHTPKPDITTRIKINSTTPVVTEEAMVTTGIGGTVVTGAAIINAYRIALKFSELLIRQVGSSGKDCQ